MTKSLVWYRQDLRTIDHEPLHHAAKTDETLGIVCADPRQFGTTACGFPKTGSHRAKFWIECLADLRAAWRELGSELIVRTGHPEDEIPAVMSALGIDQLHYHDHVGTEELAVQDAVDERVREGGRHSNRHWGQTLIHVRDLPFELEAMPEVFSPFRRAVEKTLVIRDSLPAPTRLHATIPDEFDIGTLPTGSSLGFDEPPDDPRRLHGYRGGQTRGLERIDQYIWQRDRLRIYKQTRNGMLSPDDSSKFSPWLAHGCVSPRMIVDEIRRYESERVENDSTYWLIFELLWRDYFHFITRKHQPRLFHRNGLRGVALPWAKDSATFDAWRLGRTGYPIVDANMRELTATGYMSNRGRQNVASFLTKNLGIDWRMGAEWFESQLIDYDVANNYGNWNYAAGVGNDPRGFRFFNLIKQSKQYDAEGTYVKHWIPELQSVAPEHVHEPWKIRDSSPAIDYPDRIVDLFDSATRNERAYNAAIDSANQDR